jgi:hypothetical protein
MSTDKQTDGQTDEQRVLMGDTKGRDCALQSRLFGSNCVSAHTNCSDTHVITKWHCVEHVIEFRY